MTHRTTWNCLIVVMGFFLHCAEEKMPTQAEEQGPGHILKYSEESVIPVDSAYVPAVQVCLWKRNREAAYTITFDDVRTSHYRIASAELKNRGISGTFFIDTKKLSDWKPWQMVYEMGHEIGSHTWAHSLCTDIPADLLATDFSRSQFDIISHIEGLKEVNSLAYPYGKYNDDVRFVTKKYFLSARTADRGINEAHLDQEALSRLKAYLPETPAEMDTLITLVHRALGRNGWLISGFHSIKDQGEMEPSNVPLPLFREHLDEIESLNDRLWITSQDSVVRYILMREHILIKSELKGNEIRVFLTRNAIPPIEDTRLSFQFQIPEEWEDQKIALEYNDTNRGYIYQVRGNLFCHDIAFGDTLHLFGIYKE